MPSNRFLPDLVLLVLALVAGPWMLPWPRWVVRAGGVLLAAGLVVTYLVSIDVMGAFRWTLISGVAFTWAVAVICGGAIALLLRAVRPIPTMPVRRQMLTAAPALLLGAGGFIGRRQFHVREVELRIPGLAADLDGLRLAQLSDIHLSPFLSRSDLRWCVDMANDGRPHIALVTGDLITGVRDSIDDCLDELRRLKTDAGIFGCMGNHEYYVRGQEYTAEHAAKHGIQFLRMQRSSLRFGSASLNLAGVDHQWDPDRYLRGADALLRPGELNLLMSHNPDVFPRAAEQGWDLTLSGHLHGGQINLELAQAQINLVRFRSPYFYGAYERAGKQIYVTRGIGTVGMPVRLGAPPEVAMITLRRAL